MNVREFLKHADMFYVYSEINPSEFCQVHLSKDGFAD